ncbi:DUF2231 domain-containing protein [Planotetraspora sp. GP83]|uniref:DUF2231 domain-containing protein n=1 Tax=Planotetraspora sp. GP83 TaxID=3156264 RepID=UPI00351756F5
MFDQIFGLPAHPLIIHLAVMVTPLLAVLAIGYVVLPRFRQKLDWAVVLSALAAPVSVFAAQESGDALKERLFHGQTPAAVAAHEEFADPLLFVTLGLTVVTLVLVYVTRTRRDPGAAASSSARAVTLVLSAATVLLALVVGYYVVRTGHSGATAVWAA